MSLIIGLLTIIMVLNSFFLILLILVQLPKKEAGAGLAFGSGAAEAVFGAGAGTPLSKITKYCATLFLGLALVLGVLNSYESKRNTRLMDEATAKQTTTTPSAADTVTNPGTPVTIPTVTGDGNVPTGSTDTEIPTGGTPTLEAATPGIENQEPLTLDPEVPITQPNPDN